MTTPALTIYDVTRLTQIDARESHAECGPGHECEECEYHSEQEAAELEEFEDEFEDDGQPSEYEEWQDFYGGDDWDHGQYDHDDY